MASDEPELRWRVADHLAQPGPKEGSVLGPYTLEQELGRGGAGVVFQSRTAAGKPVAIKILLLPKDPGRRRRMEREAELAAGLDHPGIVSLIEAQVEGETPYLVYELVQDARTLADAFESASLIQRLELVLQLAEAVAGVHAAGLVHRDLKPNNVLVDHLDRTWLTDLGLATGADLERLTISGVSVGTPIYMAPEQLAADREGQGPPTDVWALGLILYQALTMKHPFSAATLTELLARQGRPLVPPRELNAEVSPAVEAVCLRALQHLPHDRYADAGELTRALGDALSGAPPVPARSTARVPWGAAGGMALGLVMLSTWALWPQSEGPPALTPTPSATVSPAEGTSFDAGVLLVLALDFHQAEQEFERQPESPRALAGRAVARVGYSRRDRQAFDELTRLVAAHPARGDVRASLGLAHVLVGRREEGFEHLARALELSPEEPLVHAYQGLLHMSAEDPGRAVHCYTRALELEPNQTVRLLRGECLALAGDPEAGLVDIEQVLAAAPSAQAYLSRALALTQIDPARAEADVGRALELDPRNPGGLCTRGRLRLERGQLEAAIRDANAAIESDPHYLTSYTIRSLAYSRKGDTEGALVDLRHLIEVRPHATAFRIVAAKLELKAGRPGKAREHADAALAVDPNDAVIREEHARIVRSIDSGD